MDVIGSNGLLSIKDMSNYPKLKILAISNDFSARNPSGSALLRIINRLADKHDVSCIGGTDRPLEMHGKINYYKALKISNMGILISFVTFHISHYLVWLWLVIIKNKKYDIIQTLDAESFIGTVVTFHFCDAAYLSIAKEKRLFESNDIIGFLASIQNRFLYRLRAFVELYVCQSSKTMKIIALSNGLANDIVRFYKPKIEPVIIPNSLS